LGNARGNEQEETGGSILDMSKSRYHKAKFSNYWWE